MKIGTSVTLQDGSEHEISLGDIFKFNFKLLETASGISPFENADLYRSIKSKNADDVQIEIVKNPYGFLNFEINYFKEGELISTFNSEPSTFLIYMLSKNVCSFIENKNKEYKKNESVNIQLGDIFMIPFEEFKNKSYLNSEADIKLQKNNPKFIIFHIFNLKNVADHYPDFANIRVYALDNVNEFVGLDQKDEIKTKKENYKRYKESQGNKDAELKIDPYFIDYTLQGLSNDTLAYMNEKGFFNNKIGNLDQKELKEVEIIKMIKENKTLKVKPKINI